MVQGKIRTLLPNGRGQAESRTSTIVDLLGGQLLEERSSPWLRVDWLEIPFAEAGVVAVSSVAPATHLRMMDLKPAVVGGDLPFGALAQPAFVRTG